jgi:hypothetical protein
MVVRVRLAAPPEELRFVVQFETTAEELKRLMKDVQNTPGASIDMLRIAARQALNKANEVYEGVFEEPSEEGPAEPAPDTLGVRS